MSTLIEKAQAWMKRRGMRKNAFAAMIGVRPDRISKWIDGQGCPDAYQLRRIAEATGLPMDYWTDDEADEPPPPPAGTDPNEQAILILIRSLGLDHGDVVRALHALAAKPGVAGPAIRHVKRDGSKPGSPTPGNSTHQSKGQDVAGPELRG